MNTSTSDPFIAKRSNPIPPDQVRKIAVLRANAVGDFVVALPALDALKRQFPDAEIVLLGRHWHSSFLSGRPGPVDRVVVVPFITGINDAPPGMLPDPDALDRFVEQMRKERFDLAFQLHGGGRNSNPFVSMLGARMTIGARTPDAVALDRWVPYRQLQHESLRMLEIVALAGACLANFDARLAVTSDDLMEAETAMPDDGRPVVVIDPGSRDPRRRWPPRQFASVADCLAEEGARVIINQDPVDRSPAEETRSHMKQPGECLSLSLGGLVGLLSRSRLLVANDSGPLRLAAVQDIPCIGIFWCGNIPTYGLTRSNRAVMHVSWRMDCPACGVHCMQAACEHEDSFVADVPAGEVLASALELYRQEAGVPC